MLKSISIIAVLLVAPKCFASQIYTLNGTFSSGAPDTELLTPSVQFSASFSLVDPPVPFSWSSNQSRVSVSVSYILDGSTLTAFNPEATLWTTGAGGGFSLIFWESNNINRIRLNMSGPQLFAGPTSAPTGLVIPITFANTTGSWSYHNLDGSIISSGNFSDANVNTVPEPSAAALMICGIATQAWWLKRRREKAK